MGRLDIVPTRVKNRQYIADQGVILRIIGQTTNEANFYSSLDLIYKK